MIAYYLTHPQVTIDPAVPVPEWPLSAVGRSRTKGIADRPWLRSVRRIASSTERKAVETGAIIGDALGVRVESFADMGENDRSSTGFLESAAFEAAADRFFASPDASWNGWETATAAADRITAAVARLLADHDARAPLLLVGHGGVGTLLKCRLAGRPIARDSDQPAGGGNVFAFRIADRAVLCDWTAMESFVGIDAGAQA